MKTRKIEALLILVAVTQLVWAVWRNWQRGEAAATAWMTCLMAGLLLFIGGNILMRSKNVALIAMSVTGLMILLMLLGMLAFQTQGKPELVWMGLRFVLFLACPGIASVVQFRSAIQVKSSTAVPVTTGWIVRGMLFGFSLFVAIYCFAAGRHGLMFFNLLIWPMWIFRPSLFRVIGWAPAEDAEASDKKARRLQRQLTVMERRATGAPPKPKN